MVPSTASLTCSCRSRFRGRRQRGDQMSVADNSTRFGGSRSSARSMLSNLPAQTATYGTVTRLDHGLHWMIVTNWSYCASVSARLCFHIAGRWAQVLGPLLPTSLPDAPGIIRHVCNTRWCWLRSNALACLEGCERCEVVQLQYVLGTRSPETHC